ncbi:hypothetical protein OHA45_19105 [Streptomyces lydicus]|uniref:hypothetical protein n=1 Tax=Streptomyces lydicus TaxID=47763 RepID=UPI002E311D0F|nr:hypothetical protein [Streptomyces lydicus]
MKSWNEGKMRVRGFLTAGIASVAALIFSSTPAFAGEFIMAHTTDGKDWGGKAFFDPNGDRLKVCDLKADGMFPEVLMRWGSGAYTSIHERHGSGKCDSVSREDIPEGMNVEIRICLLDRNWNNRYCSRWVGGSA